MPQGARPAQFDDDRRRLLKRYYKLRDERQTGYDPQFRDIGELILPGIGDFFQDDLNRGGNAHSAILDNTAERAAATLAAVIMSFSTSPARQWFALSTVDPSLTEYRPAKLWLTDSTRRLQRVFSRSNTYSALHQNYEELVGFGNSCAVVAPSTERVIHVHPVTCGQYVWATGFDQSVNTLFREFKLTVGQCVAEFGFDRCSSSVQNRYRNNDLDSQVTVIHAIEPRRDRDPRYRDAKNMPWRSLYFEAGNTRRGTDYQTDAAQATEWLSEGGYPQFPVLAGRWRTSGGNTYARGPGHSAIGDVKSLQHLQQRFGLCVDLQTDPPLAHPPTMANRTVDGLPGGRNPVPDGPGIRPIFESRLELQYLLESIRDTRTRIERAFFVDLLLMLSQGPDYPQKTAHEIVERHEEKLMLIGPAQQRMEQTIQKPLIQVTLGYMIDAGLLLPPPPELLDVPLNIDFLSVFSQAQRAVGMFATDRFINTIGALSSLRPDVTDKLDVDRMVERYGSDLGIDPETLRSDDQVAEVRRQRAEADAKQQQAEQMAVGAKAARDLSQALPGDRTANTDVLGNLQGYTSPSAVVQ